MFKKFKMPLIITIILLFAAVLLFLFAGSSKSSNVVLSASVDKALYKSGEKIKISAILKNSGSKPVCLSESVQGNLKFVSATRDGKDIETRVSASDYLTSFSEILKSKLIEVAPEETMKLVLASEHDPGLNVQALHTTIPDDTSGIATFYNVQKPGDYSFEISYEYPGESSANCNYAPEKAAKTATITFSVE